MKRWWRRVRRARSQRTRYTRLPILVKVFAAFSKIDGEIEEREIDSALGFLRYDYPETVYSELRQHYRAALRGTQDLNEIAKELAHKLSLEDKILLGVQLYALISRADLQKDHLIAFYLFMTNLGIASEAIDIVYQLNTSETGEAAATESESEESVPQPQPAGQPLETLLIAKKKPCEVVLPGLSDRHSVMGFRFEDLVLLKNIGSEPVIMRGRQIREGEFIRLFEGQRVLLGETVLDYQDLIFYFNAKKNVSATKLYVSFNSHGESYVEKARTNKSHLEIRFGLGIEVESLRDSPAEINNVRLIEGRIVEASLADKIQFDDRTEIFLTDLRRRARVFGGRFDLHPTRSDYLISNNAKLLREGDILLSAGIVGELLLHIRCDHENKTGELEVVKSDRSIFIDDFPVKFKAALKDGDTITIGDGQFLRCHFSEGIIEEERNVVSRLQVHDVSLSYGKRSPALDAISMTASRGEMICVMGPSGCGKSSLLKVLGGLLSPDSGKVLVNGVDMYRNTRNRRRVTPYISYIPHEEALDPLLTVEENLDLAAAIRAPHLDDADRKRRADSKLVELGLSEFRHRLAGDDESKTLSGGQRKRLNAGLDMIGISDIYLFDEPTSGLSSKDSEHVLEIIRGLSHNKIVFVSIHQPSARLFHMFHKAILLDHGGKLAFFGTPQQMLAYFHQVEQEETVGTDASQLDAVAPKQPDFIFDVLETPLRDLSGDLIYEEDLRGHLTPLRRFSPNFWRDRFQTYRLLQEVTLEDSETDPNPVKPPPMPRRTASDDMVQFVALFKRAFLSKMRNKANLATTLLQAPILALLVSFVLRYSEDGVYNFSAAFHIPTYLFLTLVIGMFLGLTNSADEIIRDRTLLSRERNHRIRVSHYIVSKICALSIFALIQCVVYVLVGDAVLSIRSMFWVNLLWMFLTTFVGVIFGLLISSVVPNSKTALNIIPLILIPNIILGGALIKYEEMNRDVDLIHAVQGWFGTGNSDESEMPSNLEVPKICQIMPLRWSYEGVIISHAEFNPVSRLQRRIQKTIKALAMTPDGKLRDLTPEEEDRLYNAKQALAILAGLEAESPAKLRGQLRYLQRSLITGEFENEAFQVPSNVKSTELMTSEELFLNSKIQDLFTRAEVERTDYRRKVQPNVFFGAERQLQVPSISVFGFQTPERDFKVPTVLLDVGVLVIFSLLGTILLYFTVRHRIRSV